MIESKKKNVHAFITGEFNWCTAQFFKREEVFHGEDRLGAPYLARRPEWRLISYNPYNNSHFIIKPTEKQWNRDKFGIDGMACVDAPQPNIVLMTWTGLNENRKPQVWGHYNIEREES